MRIAVTRETRPGEARVAVVPALVGRLSRLGTVVVEPGAGLLAHHPDSEYVAAGASVEAPSPADIVLSVGPLPGRWAGLARVATISLTAPDPPGRVPAYALELVPRISRAQPMDALTSQSLVAGYRGAIVAAELLRRMFGVQMTAAGTVPAARVLVLGAGVAGLEAIATVRRLGAQVEAYDVRASSAEEIRSLGAVALDLGLPPLEGAAAYARELTPELSSRQQQLLAPSVARADVVITTAAVPGRPAPLLVTRAMVEAMRAGSVVVDIVAEAGGNVEGVVAGKTVTVGGVRLWGGRDVPSQLPGPASQLLAHNMVSLVELVALDADDEILAACRVRGGAPRP